MACFRLNLVNARASYKEMQTKALARFDFLMTKRDGAVEWEVWPFP